MSNKKKVIDLNNVECVCGHTMKEHATTSGWCTSWFINSKHSKGGQCCCKQFQPDVINNKKVIDLNDIPDGVTLKQHIRDLEKAITTRSKRTLGK